MADGYTKSHPTRPNRRGSLEEINVHVLDKSRRLHGPYLSEVSKVPTRYLYINEGYSGSISSIAQNRGPSPRIAPPTGVVREQYWTCSKWPRGQRLMAMALGVLAGAVIGLAITMSMRANGHDPNLLSPVFRSSVPE